MDESLHDTMYDWKKKDKIKDLNLPKKEPRYRLTNGWIEGPFKYCPTYGMNHVIDTRTSCKQLGHKNLNEINTKYYVMA